MKESTKKKALTIASLALSVALLIGLIAWIAKPREGGEQADCIDLTAMSSTVMAAQINDMFNVRPEEYLGKTVRAQGRYDILYSAATGKDYYYVVSEEALACCASGIEFLYNGARPIAGTTIKVEGTFRKYVELGSTYYYLDLTYLSVVS